MTPRDWSDIIVNGGGMTALAIFAIWVLNRVWSDRLREAQKNADEIRQQWEATRKALEENTRVVTLLTERLERLLQS